MNKAMAWPRTWPGIDDAEKALRHISKNSAEAVSHKRPIAEIGQPAIALSGRVLAPGGASFPPNNHLKMCSLSLSPRNLVVRPVYSQSQTCTQTCKLLHIVLRLIAGS